MSDRIIITTKLKYRKNVQLKYIIIIGIYGQEEGKEQGNNSVLSDTIKNNW